LNLFHQVSHFEFIPARLANSCLFRHDSPIPNLLRQVCQIGLSIGKLAKHLFPEFKESGKFATLHLFGKLTTLHLFGKFATLQLFQQVCHSAFIFASLPLCIRQKFICKTLPARMSFLSRVTARLPKTFILLVAKTFILCRNSR
jgi:hypothetical protein